MSADADSAGDAVRVAVLVRVEPAAAFRVFTEEIDAWWLRGPRYRASGRQGGTLRLEPGVGGRLQETFESGEGVDVFVSGTVTRWEPPRRLTLDWRARNFGPDERTEVDVTFEPSAGGTLVTVVHRGWSALPPDHPVRHGQAVGPFLRSMGMWWGEQAGSLRRLTGSRPS